MRRAGAAILMRRHANRRPFAIVFDDRHLHYHRLSGVLGWVTPAERYDGTPSGTVALRISRP